MRTKKKGLKTKSKARRNRKNKTTNKIRRQKGGCINGQCMIR